MQHLSLSAPDVATLNASPGAVVRLENHWVADLDFHRTPSPYRALAEVALPGPQALAARFTGRGGVHLLYATRTEAAAAAVDLVACHPGASGCEVIQRTRGGNWAVQAPSTPALASWREHNQAVAFDDRPAPWDQYEMGARVDHALCPIHPSPSTRDATVVEEGGVRCYRCQGFRSWAALAGRGGAWSPWAAFRAGVHLDQALPALRMLSRGILPDIVLCDAWRYLANLILGEGHPLFGASTRRHGIIRDCTGVWCCCDGSLIQKQVEIPLRGLPVVLYADDRGEVHIDPNRYTAARNGGDLGLHWPSVRFVRRRPLLSSGDASRLVVDLDSRVNRDLTADPFRKFEDFAEPEGDEAELRAVLETNFPGLPYEALELCVGGIIYASRQPAMPPMLALTGPAGSGKGVLPRLAAVAVGGRADVLPPSDRLPELFLESLRAGHPVVVLDESLKSPMKTRERLLGLQGFTSTRALYIGKVDFGVLSLIVLTGTGYPHTWEQDDQLARRLIHYRFAEARPQWMAGADVEGLAQSAAFRRGANALVNRLLSEIENGDEWWHKWALRHAPPTPRATDLRRDAVRDFFALLAPKLGACPNYPGRYAFKPSDLGELQDVWLELADGEFGDSLYRSERLTECDLKALFSLNRPVELKLQKFRRWLLITCPDVPILASQHKEPSA